MPSEMQNSPEAFRESVRLLVELHHEMSTGDPDGDKADSIRDAMDRPWYRMTDSESTQLRGLSADLYAIGHIWEAPREIPGDFSKSARDALKDERFDDLLEHVRNNEKSLAPDLVAYLRGLAWSRMGEWPAAVAFFQEAVRVSPHEQPGYIHCYLGALLALDRADDAVCIAKEIVAKDNDPLLLLDAAEVFFVRSTELDGVNVESMLRIATETAKRGLILAAKEKPSETLVTQCVSTQLWLALYHARSNNWKSAEDSIRSARSLRSDEHSVLFIESFLKQLQRPASWDHGVGKGLIQLREIPTGATPFAPIVNSVLN